MKKELRVGSQLMAEITGCPSDTAISEPTWAPQPECKCGGHGCGDDAWAGGTMGGGTIGGGSGGVSAKMSSSQIHEELQAVGRLLPSWVVICLRALAKVLEAMVEGHGACPHACPACVHG